MGDDTYVGNFTFEGRENVRGVRVPSRAIPPPWWSIRFRLAPRTYAPWGRIVRVVSLTKSWKLPTRKILPLFFVIMSRAARWGRGLSRRRAAWATTAAYPARTPRVSAAASGKRLNPIAIHLPTAPCCPTPCGNGGRRQTRGACGQLGNPGDGVHAMPLFTCCVQAVAGAPVATPRPMATRCATHRAVPWTSASGSPTLPQSTST